MHMNTLNTLKCVTGGVRMGFRRQGKVKRKEKIFYIGRSAVPRAAALFLSCCLRAVAEEWQTG